jgi:hypothetical protein
MAVPFTAPKRELEAYTQASRFSNEQRIAAAEVYQNARILTPTGPVNRAGAPFPNVKATGYFDFSGLPANAETLTINGVVFTFEQMVAATGQLTFGANPANNDTLPALNGFNTIVFKSSAGAFPQIQIGANLAATLVTLAAALQTNKVLAGNELLAGFNYTADATHLIVTSSTLGAAGNAYTFGASTANITRSAATLASGVGPTTDPVKLAIDSTLVATLALIASKLNASVNASVSPATYASDGVSKVTITHDTFGTAGNSFTLAEAVTNATRSAATLTGGID